MSGEKALGICLGASTISAVLLCKESKAISVKKVIVRPHNGNPKGVFSLIINTIHEPGIPVLVTGRKFRRYVNIPSITEPRATEYALRFTQDGSLPYQALVSAGGETFMVYRLTPEHRIAGVSTGNKCASGTGEFFMQQIGRMGLDIEHAVSYAEEGTPYRVSGRCTVFCKSDCTHALNKGEPITNVTAGLCEMIAKKIIDITGRISRDRIILVGGMTRNRAVVNNVKKYLKDVHIPHHAPYFEAFGAAIAAFTKGKTPPHNLFTTEKAAFSFLPPIKAAENLVTFHSINMEKAKGGERCIIGLDVGSTTTKAVLLRLPDNAILASVYLRTNGDPVRASRSCFRNIKEQLGETDVCITGIGVTGSGRQIAGLFILTGSIINEIIAHSSAAVYFDPDVDTIFEIGGQDAKYTCITNAVASDYAMNQACSAGTGSFLEEAAYESFRVGTEEIATFALRGNSPPNFSDQCAAFISSDIKNALHEGISRENIMAGLVYSICFNYINRVKGNRPVGKKIFMQGGVCYNPAVPMAMAAILKKQIIVPPEPGLMGAFGVALEVGKRIGCGMYEEKTFHLDTIIERRVTYETPFTCSGGKEGCDLKCRINRIRLDGRLYPFGGACDRYYTIRMKKKQVHTDGDYIRYRNTLMRKKFCHQPPTDKKKSCITIGLNNSFITLRLLPLYHAFFTALGCSIVMPSRASEGASGLLVTSMCYPAEIAIGFFKELLSLKPDYIFIPHVKELYVPGGNERLGFCATCGFSRGEAFYCKQAFHNTITDDLIVSPTIIFNGGWEKGRNAFIKVAERLGFSKKEALSAFRQAVEAQYSFERQCEEKGREVLEWMYRNPDAIGIVIFGRPYNAYAPEANKGIPEKFTSRGYRVIPFDMLPYRNEPIPEEYADYMTWEAGQRILRAARLVERHNRLFGVFITNFLCAPDSFIVPYFRRIMGTKPSLTLELDAHTADAGINTRIDAFCDIIHNYRKARKPSPLHRCSTFSLARTVFKHKGIIYRDSSGKEYNLTDHRVKLLLPPMGPLSSVMLAAIMRKIGIRAEALPPTDSEALHLGRSVTTGKECLPLIIILGTLVRYLKNRRKTENHEKLIIFVPKATGHCRFGQYHVYTNQYIKENKLKDIAVLDLGMEDRFVGFGPSFSLAAWKSIIISDLLEDILFALKTLAKDREKAMDVFFQECGRIVSVLEGSVRKSIYKQLEETSRTLGQIPLRQSYEETAKIALTGEFFVRRDHFSHCAIGERLAEEGFIVTKDPVMATIYYANFMIKEKIVKPRYTLAGLLEFIIADRTERLVEKKIKTICALSGLCSPEMIDIDDIISHSELFIPRECDGDQGAIIGLTMRDGLTHYCGVINAGPFGCMQTRFADAVLIPRADVEGKTAVLQSLGKQIDLSRFGRYCRIPYLSVESDGNPYPQLLEARMESFILEAERIAGIQGKKRAPSP